MKPTYFLIALALVLIYFMVELFNPFLKALIVSILLTISTSSLTLKLERNIKNRILSTTIITLGMTALFFIPILYCIFSFATFFNQMDQALLIANLNEIKNMAHRIIMEFPFLNDFFKETLQEHKIDFHHPIINDETARKYKFEIRNNLRTYLE